MRRREQRGSNMSLTYNRNLIPRAKELRKNMTPQEKHLWYDFLSRYHPRFQRQKTIGSFIADFYCHAARLVLEIDAGQHYTEAGRARDAERTAILEGYDLQVMRFTNLEIDRQFEAVCIAIDNAVKERS